MFKLAAKTICFISIIFVLDRGAAYLLEKGLNNCFGFNRKANVLLIGHSHTVSGIDENGLEKKLGVPVAKYAIAGADTFNRLEMIKHYFSEHADTVKVVVFDVDSNTFNSQAVSSNAYRLFYPYQDNAVMANYLENSAGSWSEYMSRKLLKMLRYNTPAAPNTPSIRNEAVGGLLAHYKIRLLEKETSGNSNQIIEAVEGLKRDIREGRKVKRRLDVDNIKKLDETISFVRAHKARMILLYIPTVDLLHELDRNNHEQILALFKKYAENDTGVIFLNYNPMYDKRYELFSDPAHLNSAGQKLVTEQLSKDLLQYFEN